MGTVMTVCMIVAILGTLHYMTGVPRRQAPLWIRRSVGIIAALAGCWNALWHATRHLSEFWGLMALGSGLLMLVCAAYLLHERGLPTWIRALLPVVVLALGAFAATYAISIYRL